MKKIVLTAASIIGIVAAYAQPANEHLDINNIKAQVNSDGALFWNYALGEFEVPNGSGRNTIFANGLWIGGYDASNVLRIAGQTYRQTGVDFWPGPLDATGSTDSATIVSYDRFWKLNQCDIDTYKNWIDGGSVGVNPTDPTAMNTILTWPAVSSFGDLLAPYYDNNSNNVYEPTAGDYPMIKGDQCIFFVYNDKGGLHTETGGGSIGLELQAMVYGYGCPDDSALFNTVFTHYKVINKGSFTLDSTFIGNWTDFDIGNPLDDFVECDVARGTYFAYNGDSLDENVSGYPLGYGLNPPAQSVTFLAGPYANANGVDDLPTSTPNGMNYGDMIIDNERLGMSRFVYFNNDASLTGNPSGASDFYNYLAGYWKDATSWTYGGTGHLTGVQCDFMFPSNTDPLGFGTGGVPQTTWDENTSGNFPNDRRGLGSFGPFKMHPGSVNEIDFAYVYGKANSGGNLASVAVMKERIDSVKQQFNNGISGCGCDAVAGINTPSQVNNSLSIYPNPASDNITISFNSVSRNLTARIYDAQGRVVKKMENISAGETTFSVSDLNAGLFLLQLQEDGRSSTKTFIKR